MAILVNILVASLGLGYYLYTGQIQFPFTIYVIYILSIALLKLWAPQRKIVIDLFSLFFLIYGALVLFSHIELIHDPFHDYYVHNDAAESFYKGTMNYVLPCSWSELPDKTLFNPIFSHYPLAEFIMGAVGKLGMDLGVENLRLFLRIHIFLIGAFVIAIMTNLLKDKKFSDIQIKKYIIPFGLCSYLFITSAIFSRDIHVCLIYTIAAYISLKDHVKGRLLIFILLFFLAAGLRPQNGIAYLIYPIAFYWKTITKKIGLFGIGVIALICLVLFYYLQDSLELLYESLGTYDDFSKSNTGGIFIEFYSLPFPLNTIVMVIYMALMPLPLFKCCIGMGGTWLNLPTIFSSYLIYVCFMVCIYYLCHSKFKGAYVGTILVCLIAYAGIIYGSPDERRAFAAIPGLYMCYALVKQRIPKGHYIRYRNIGWMLITVVQLFFIVYVYTR